MTTFVTVNNLSDLIEQEKISKPLLNSWRDSHTLRGVEFYVAQYRRFKWRVGIGALIAAISFVLPIVNSFVVNEYELTQMNLISIGGMFLGLMVAGTPMVLNKDCRRAYNAITKFVDHYNQLSKTSGRPFSMLATMSKEHLQDMASTSLVNLCRQMLVYAGDKPMSKEQFDLQYKIEKTYDLYASFGLVFGGYGRYYEKAKAMNRPT